MKIRQIIGLVLIIEVCGYLVTDNFVHEEILEFADECKKAINKKKNSSNNNDETA